MDLSWFEIGAIMLLVSMLVFAFCIVIVITLNTRASDMSIDMKNTLYHYSTARYLLNKYPLRGKVAIVTGSSAGLGEGVADELYSMGACVIIASRTLSRCEDAVAKMKKAHPRSEGSLYAMQLDVSDFDNVRAFTKRFTAKFPKLHFLVNNAGIHYMSAPGAPMFDTSIKCESKQGFDLSFASNYMGHFLLVQLLLPRLTETGKGENVPTRVVNISSAYHISVDGNMLQSTPIATQSVGADSSVHASAPLAARMDINSRLHRRRAYGNSKLAQILFTHELDRRLKAEDNYDVEVVSVCPGWVSGTHIAPPGPVGKIITFFGCELNRGCFAPIGACINPWLKGGEHVTNYKPFWNYMPFSVLSALGIRDISSDLLGMFLLLVQSFSVGCHVIRSSPESYNVKLAMELFDWTQEAVKVTSE